MILSWTHFFSWPFKQLIYNVTKKLELIQNTSKMEQKILPHLKHRCFLIAVHSVRQVSDAERSGVAHQCTARPCITVVCIVWFRSALTEYVRQIRRKPLQNAAESIWCFFGRLFRWDRIHNKLDNENVVRFEDWCNEKKTNIHEYISVYVCCFERKNICNLFIYFFFQIQPWVCLSLTLNPNNNIKTWQKPKVYAWVRAEK